MINTYDLKISQPDYFKQLAVRDMLYLYYKCPQVEDKVNLYTHYNEIIFTLAGNKLINHREKTWLSSKDTSLFVKRTAYHQKLYPQSNEWEVIAFYFKDNFMQDVFKTYRASLPLNNLPPPPPDMLIEIDVNEATKSFYYSTLPYFSQQQPPSEQLLEFKFRELLFIIFSNPANKNLLSYVNSISDQLKPSLHEIMEANFSFNLTLEEYARIAQRSLATFKREFEELYHTTPGKWLAEKRLNYAKHLLETSAKNVNEIAYDSGFENISHFSRVFKEKFGMAPLQYRKQNSVTLKTAL